MGKITVGFFRLDEEGNTFEFKTINNDLSDYYDLLNCSYIDIQTRKIGERYFNVIFDEEGLWKPNQRFSLCSQTDSSLNLVGNIIVVGNRIQNGDLTSLTQDDFEYLCQFVRNVQYKMSANSGTVFAKVLVAV